MIVELEKELIAALTSPAVVSTLEGLVRRAFREELARAGLGDELLDVKRAAALLGMTPAAVSKGCQRGSLPCMRIGHRIRFRRYDLLKSNPIITGLKL